MQASLPRATTSNPSSEPPVPQLLNDLQWLTAYLTVHSLTDSSRVYSYLLWIAIGILFICFSLSHVLGLRGGYLGAYWSKWALRRRTFRKKSSLAQAAKLGQPHRQPKALPSNAQILSLVGLIVVSLAVAYVGPDYLPPGTYIWKLSGYATASIGKRYTNYDPSVFLPWQAKYIIPKAWWTTAARTGQIAFALFPLCVVLALKTAPFAVFSISWLTDLHFDKLAWLHRWTGFLIWVFSTIHIASWSVQLSQGYRKGIVLYSWAFKYQKFLFGWTGYGCLTLLMIFSIPPLRKRHYEVFYTLHIILVPLTLVFAALHHPIVWEWLWIALGLWLGERLFRFAKFIWINGFLGSSSRPAGVPQQQRVINKEMGGRIPPLNTNVPYPPESLDQKLTVYDEGYIPPPGYFHAELLPGRSVRLRIILPRSITWAPGQHFLINIPFVFWLTTHPFTAASICDSAANTDAGREIQFIVRAKKGWTKELWDTVALMAGRGLKLPPGESLPPGTYPPPRGVLMRGFVDGPFGSSRRAKWGDYSTVLLVAGGSGVSFALSVLEYLCLCMAGRDGRQLGGRAGGWGKPKFKTTRVRFVWLVREFGHIQWCASAIRRCMAILPPNELQIDIFVTNLKVAPSVQPNAQLLQRLQKVPDQGELVPPSPGFAREDKPRQSAERHSRSSSLHSIETDDENENADGLVDLSYYESDFAGDENGELGHEEHILDYTNWEGDDDTALPGEAQLNLSVKQEGKRRRSFLKRASMAIQGKQDYDKRSTAIYDYTSSPSTVRLLDAQPPRPLTIAAPSLDTISEHSRGARSPRFSRELEHLRSPLSPLQTPTSAVALLPDRSSLPYGPSPTPPPQEQLQPLQQHDPSHPSHPLQPTQPPHPSLQPSQPPPMNAAAPIRPTSTRPGSVFSTITALSDVNSVAALISETSEKEQVRLDLDEGELADIGVVAERARPGKPRLDRILADEVERSKGAVIVGCCGPTSLNALLRKNIAAQIDPARIRRGDMRGHIALVAEDFEY